MKCYACTTINADRFLDDIQDWSWKKWFENIRFVPKMRQCGDKFNSEDALGVYVKRQACDDGVCMKMAFTFKNSGEAYIWRNCVLNTRNEDVQPGCTQITSSKGTLDVCICDWHLCNGVVRTQIQSFNLFLIQITVSYLVNKCF
ncbi:unnamed protein product [Acanthocheilonema viteae]|uniref:Protein quiver n=1 Tax=Acanthocheilonema viteae TaxID=6277 RepID=A0A498SGX9_ACAVI|nr:unnamed protein product [Acanthocheilonema viteae]